MRLGCSTFSDTGQLAVGQVRGEPRPTIRNLKSDMKHPLPFFAATLLAAILSGCVGPDAPKLDDRVHGSVGVQATNLDPTRIVPERPSNSPSSAPAASSSPSGPVLIPGSN